MRPFRFGSSYSPILSGIVMAKGKEGPGRLPVFISFSAPFSFPPLPKCPFKYLLLPYKYDPIGRLRRLRLHTSWVEMDLAGRGRKGSRWGFRGDIFGATMEV